MCLLITANRRHFAIDMRANYFTFACTTILLALADPLVLEGRTTPILTCFTCCGSSSKLELLVIKVC